MKTYLCPKCKKRNMTKNGHNRDNLQQWICRSGGSDSGRNKVYCYTTLKLERA